MYVCMYVCVGVCMFVYEYTYNVCMYVGLVGKWQSCDGDNAARS